MLQELNAVGRGDTFDNDKRRSMVSVTHIIWSYESPYEIVVQVRYACWCVRQSPSVPGRQRLLFTQRRSILLCSYYLGGGDDLPSAHSCITQWPRWSRRWTVVAYHTFLLEVYPRFQTKIWAHALQIVSCHQSRQFSRSPWYHSAMYKSEAHYATSLDPSCTLTDWLSGQSRVQIGEKFSLHLRNSPL